MSVFKLFQFNAKLTLKSCAKLLLQNDSKLSISLQTIWFSQFSRNNKWSAVLSGLQVSCPVQWTDFYIAFWGVKRTFFAFMSSVQNYMKMCEVILGVSVSMTKTVNLAHKIFPSSARQVFKGLWTFVGSILWLTHRKITTNPQQNARLKRNKKLFCLHGTFCFPTSKETPGWDFHNFFWEICLLTLTMFRSLSVKMHLLE